MGLRDKDGLSGYGNCGPQKFGFVLLVLFSSCVFFFLTISIIIFYQRTPTTIYLEIKLNKILR